MRQNNLKIPEILSNDGVCLLLETLASVEYGVWTNGPDNISDISVTQHQFVKQQSAICNK